MFELFLKQNEQEGLYIIKTIIQNGATTLSNIEDEIGKDQSTIRKKIELLNETIQQLGYKELTLTIRNGKIIIDNFNYEKHSALSSRLCEHFISMSTTYEVIQTLLKNPTISKDELIATIHISESYLNKILKKMNDALAPANMTISSKNKFYHFEGSIANWIHLIYYSHIFFSQVTSTSPQGNNTIAHKISDPFVMYQNLLIKAMSHFIDTSKMIGRDEENFMATLIDVLENEENILVKKNDSNHLKLLYYFFSCMTYNFFQHDTQRKLMSQKIIAAFDSHASHFFIRETMFITNSIYHHKDKRADSYFEMVYFCFMKQLEFSLLDPTIQTIFMTTDKYTKKDKLIIEENFSAFKIKILTLKLSPHTKDMLTANDNSILKQLYLLQANETAQTKPLNIFFSLNAGLSFLLYLKYKIVNFFSADAIQFIQTYHHADIIVADHYWNTHDSQGVLYLVNPQVTSHIDNLLDFILKQLIQKNK